MSPRSRIVLALHRLLLRLQQTRLRGLLVSAYRVIARAGSAYLTWGERGAAVYLRGGLGTADFLPGLSDVDVAIVLAGEPATRGSAARRARRRWSRLKRALPGIRLLFDWPRIYDESELRDVAGASTFTYGLGRGDDGGGSAAAYFGPRANLDRVRALERPGLYGSTTDWRLLRGPDRRPSDPDRDAQACRVAAWLELVYWWRLVFPFCVDPSMPRSADLSVKLVAEPARIWLWLAHRERASGRIDALQRALQRLPEEGDCLRRALELQRELSRRPEPLLAELIPAAVRLSMRIAAMIEAEVEEAGATEVRLVGADSELVAPEGRGPDPSGGDGRSLLPLADWRSLARPELPDETLALLSGDPGDPAALAAAAISHGAGPYPALRTGGLMVLPAVGLPRSRLRSVKCAAADPALFALAEGARTASFPEVRGWSAADSARRAVAEHRVWLRAEPAVSGGGPAEESGRALGMLLTAARAALFLESIDEGEPELCLTVSETAARLTARSPTARSSAGEALDRYHEFALRGARPPARTIAQMRTLVLGLPGYRHEAGAADKHMPAVRPRPAR